ncbi:MAG TPA: hypothetical protein VFF73_02705 [Planctomycetota bacterium]|nr:hypothetical protein [Planctomycetota bacterium]
MRHAAALLLAALVAGCGSVETREDQAPRVTVAADSPPPALGELPDFGDPKPPVAAPRGSKEVESTRDALLNNGGH